VDQNFYYYRRLFEIIKIQYLILLGKPKFEQHRSLVKSAELDFELNPDAGMIEFLAKIKKENEKIEKAQKSRNPLY